MPDKAKNKETIKKLRVRRDNLWLRFQNLQRRDSFSGLGLSSRLNEVQQKLDRLGDRSKRYETEITVDIG